LFFRLANGVGDGGRTTDSLLRSALSGKKGLDTIKRVRLIPPMRHVIVESSLCSNINIYLLWRFSFCQENTIYAGSAYQEIDDTHPSPVCDAWQAKFEAACCFDFHDTYVECPPICPQGQGVVAP
jgi:hypothetical protein